MNIRIQKVTTLSTPRPSYQTAGASGMDLHAAIPERVAIEPGQRLTIGCGYAFEIPDGFEAQVRPRSGLASKRGLDVIGAPGTVDSDYRGEVRVTLVNLSFSDICYIEPNDRIAQLVIGPVMRARLTLVDALDETARGVGGFGSTGVTANVDEEPTWNARFQVEISKYTE